MPTFKKYKIGDAIDLIKDGYTPSSDEHLHYIGLEHIEQQTLRLVGTGKSSEVTSNKFRFKSGDVLFGKLRPYFRKVYRSKFDGVCSTDIWVARAKKNFDQGFIFYFMANEEFIDLSSQGSSGTRMPRADWNNLKNIEWEFPEETTQNRIANILSSLDDKIELNRRTNHTLEQIAQTLFKKYFVDDIDPENLPEGWRWGKLGDVTIRITKGTTPTTLKKQFVLSGINFLKVENLTEYGTFDKSKLNFIDEETDKLLSRSRIENKDILFSIAGTLGRMALVNESILPANTNQALAIIRPDLNIIEPLYIFYWLKQSNLREEIFSKSVQGVQANLSLGVLSDINIVIPAIETLVEKFESINPIYKKIEQNENEITVLVKIRDSLLPKLMSGEIEVNVAEKVSETELTK